MKRKKRKGARSPEHIADVPLATSVEDEKVISKENRYKKAICSISLMKTANDMRMI